MCNKRSSTYILPVELRKHYQIPKYANCKVDDCLANLIWVLNNHGVQTLACCCGHGKYNLSIVYKSPNKKIFDLISGKEIPRKKRFYLKDKQGYYYIPECIVDGTPVKETK